MSAPGNPRGRTRRRRAHGQSSRRRYTRPPAGGCISRRQSTKKLDESLGCQSGLVNELSKETNLEESMVWYDEGSWGLCTEEDHVATAPAAELKARRATAFRKSCPETTRG